MATRATSMFMEEKAPCGALKRPLQPYPEVSGLSVALQDGSDALKAGSVVGLGPVLGRPIVLALDA